MEALTCPTKDEWRKAMEDGSIENYKAQLVVKGYTQQEGINNEETIYLVVRFA